VLLLEQPVQGLPIECGHQQVTQEQIVAALLQEGECGVTISGGLDRVTIPLEEAC
jgi:hypothetical protein